MAATTFEMDGSVMEGVSIHFRVFLFVISRSSFSIDYVKMSSQEVNVVVVAYRLKKQIFNVSL